MLLVYSSDLHLFISPVYNGDFLIQPSNVSLSPGTYEVTPFATPANATVEIVAVVWGLGHITNQTVIDSLYSAIAAGLSWEWSNAVDAGRRIKCNERDPCHIDDH